MCIGCMTNGAIYDTLWDQYRYLNGETELEDNNIPLSLEKENDFEKGTIQKAYQFNYPSAKNVYHYDQWTEFKIWWYLMLMRDYKYYVKNMARVLLVMYKKWMKETNNMKRLEEFEKLVNDEIEYRNKKCKNDYDFDSECIVTSRYQPMYGHNYEDTEMKRRIEKENKYHRSLEEVKRLTKLCNAKNKKINRHISLINNLHNVINKYNYILWFSLSAISAYAIKSFLF